MSIDKRALNQGAKPDCFGSDSFLRRAPLPCVPSKPLDFGTLFFGTSCFILLFYAHRRPEGCPRGSEGTSPVRRTGERSVFPKETLEPRGLRSNSLWAPMSIKQEHGQVINSWTYHLPFD